MTNLDEVLERLSHLPPLPESIQRLNRMIDGKQTTLRAVGLEIERDQAMSVQVLRLVNSSYYGCSVTVSSIRQAVILLGLNAIRTLVSSSWLFGMIENSSQGFHHHSLACARSCFILSRALGIGEPEELSALGLLHDIGKVVLAKYLPADFDRVCVYARENRVCFHEAELEVLGVTHAALGACLLEKWNLPANTVVPVEYHHCDELPGQFHEQTAVLILADLIVRAEGYGYAGDLSMPDFPENVAATLDLKVRDLQMLSQEVCDQLRDIPRYIGAKAV